jgi:hypothetical protein
MSLRQTLRVTFAAAVTAGTLLAAARAQPTPAAKAPRFERDVLPILQARCLKCHGDATRKAGLDLRTPAAMLRGGTGGPVLVKGDAAKSLLFEQVATHTMPPGKTAKLTAAQIQTLRAWIDAGAPADRAETAFATVAARDRDFWAFRPPVRPAVPPVKRTDRVRTPIDAFVLARLEAKGLSFSPDADRLTLLRRVHHDLLGLPPSPDEMDAFLADTAPGAYERLVERLLASPHYGERWARHWLDAAGYADTVGTDNDAEIIRVRDGLWRYRDYVVRALNADRPFERFLTEQLAGDELVDWRSAAKFTPGIVEALTATGFLRTAVDNTTEAELNRPLERHEVLHGTLEILGSNLLGLTVSCARCHDHKFDPIPQEEYYRLLACLTPAYNPQAWVQPQDRHVEDVSAADKQALIRHNAEIDRQAAVLNGKLADLLRPHQQRLFEVKLATLPEVIRADVRTALAMPPGKRSVVQNYLADKLGPGLKVRPDETEKGLTESERHEAERLRREVTAVQGRRVVPGKIQALVETGPPPATHLLRRGSHLTPGPEVAPGFLSLLTPPGETVAIPPAPAGAKTSGRRTALARWLTRPDHPLTARVLVNRVWQQYFGEGIVATPDNFGRSGARPTHPELLDWLATEFVRGGWGLKQLHRLILTSTVYRQASASPLPAAGGADPRQVDPGNQLLWRMRLRRVEAEVVRDSVLAISGRLDRTPGGPPVPIETRKDGMVVVAGKGLASPTAADRRSLYLLARRNYQLSLLNVFDQPVMSTNCTRRSPSTVPLQALTFLNDAFILEQAEHFARRVVAAAGPDARRRIETAFRLALVRSPTAAESEAALRLLERQASRHRTQPNARPEEASLRALAHLCQMLLCTNEFLYVG